ncbi:11922_t:CDS:2, partial [Acaulospora colombiana]
LAAIFAPVRLLQHVETGAINDQRIQEEEGLLWICQHQEAVSGEKGGPKDSGHSPTPN